MRIAFLAPAIAATLCVAAPVKAESFDHLLRGTYAVSGTDMCIASFAGFNVNLVAQPPFFSRTTHFIGIRVFNGNGTGSQDDTNVTNTVFAGPPAAESSASSRTTGNITYTVARDHTVTVVADNIAGTSLTPAFAAGDTFTIGHVMTSGKLSQDRRTLVLASDSPEIETITLATGVVEKQICARSRTLIKVNDETDSE
jgi:hypothetical protein